MGEYFLNKKIVFNKDVPGSEKDLKNISNSDNYALEGPLTIMQDLEYRIDALMQNIENSYKDLTRLTDQVVDLYEKEEYHSSLARVIKDLELKISIMTDRIGPQEKELLNMKLKIKSLIENN